MVYFNHNFITIIIASIFRVILLQHGGKNVVYCVAVCTSPTACSNQYTTPSTHHLQFIPNIIPHRRHITYSLLQSVYHTAYP